MVEYVPFTISLFQQQKGIMSCIPGYCLHKPDQHMVVKINYLIQFPPLWYLMKINEANKISDIGNIFIRFQIPAK